MGELDWGARLGSSIGEDVRTSPLRIFGIRIWCALQLRTTIVNAGRGISLSVRSGTVGATTLGELAVNTPGRLLGIYGRARRIRC